MKLGELRGAIRKSKGNPTVVTTLGGSVELVLALQKTALLAELERAFPGGKGVETGLSFSDDGDGGVLQVEGVTVASMTTLPADSIGETVDLLADEPLVKPSELTDLLV